MLESAGDVMSTGLDGEKNGLGLGLMGMLMAVDGGGISMITSSWIPG